MHTYLPYPDFTASAEILIKDILIQQCKDAYEVLTTLVTKRTTWSDHHAVVMWRGCEVSLWRYATAMGMELNTRYPDNELYQLLLFQISELTEDALRTGHIDIYGKDYQPWWLGTTDIHKSHQSLLKRKFPHAYGHKWPNVPSNWPLIMPESRPPVPILTKR